MYDMDNQWQEAMMVKYIINSLYNIINTFLIQKNLRPDIIL